MAVVSCLAPKFLVLKSHFSLSHLVQRALNQQNINVKRTFLVVQWLRLHAPNIGLWVQLLVRELIKSHMLCVVATVNK